MRALVLMLLLGGTTLADTSVKKKGQTGDACKTNADCDQSKQPQVCNQNKCQVNIPPPPT
jgi:hypothetical protein